MKAGFQFFQATAEADRCLLCYDAPCSKGCPSDTDPGTFIRKLKFRNIKGAINTIKENNIMGGVCGVLCPTSELCEKECAATLIDRPIRIGKIQRYLIEHAWKENFIPLNRQEPNGLKTAVIGAGPSGLSCAASLALKGYEVDVFEKKEEPGGMLRYLIPDYRLSKEFLSKELLDIISLGVNIKCSSPIDSAGKLDELLSDGYSAVYIATGTWKDKGLGLDSNKSGLYKASDFLQKCKTSSNTGMSEKLQGKTVCVIGGGDTAINTAEVCVKLGAKDVSVIYRRSYLQMPGDEKEKISALRAGINFIILTQPINYLVEDGKINRIEVITNTLGDTDSSGRPRPVPIDNSNHYIDTDIVVEAAGLEPDPENDKIFISLKSEKGLIVIDPANGKTSQADIYAGGDIVRGPSLIVEAVADGKRAAKTISENAGHPDA